MKQVVTKEERIKLKEYIKESIPTTNVATANYLLLISSLSIVVYTALIIFDKYTNSFEVATMVIVPCVSIVIAVFCKIKKGMYYWFRHALLFCLALLVLIFDIKSHYNSRLTICIPLILAMRYFDKKYLMFCSSICILFVFAGVCINAYYYDATGIVDLNTVAYYNPTEIIAQSDLMREIIATTPPNKLLLINGLLFTFLPNTIYVIIITIIIIRVMEKNLLVINKSNRLAYETAEVKNELNEMKTKVVLSQVKPHFIYNTLTSIARLCDKNPKKAKSLTVDFSQYLRGNLDNLGEDNELCNFEIELNHIKNYLNIELVRFEDTLKVDYDINAKDFLVPVLSIQPLVENAVKHGVCKKEDGGTVKIQTLEKDDAYIIKIIDDGVGFDPNKKPDDNRNHVGVANSIKRLEMYGNKLEIESEVGVGTTATVTIYKKGAK